MSNKYFVDNDDLSVYIQGLEARIKALESSPQIQSTSIDAGSSLVAKDSTGFDYLFLGQYPPLDDNRFGISVRAEDPETGISYVPFYVHTLFGVGAPNAAMPAMATYVRSAGSTGTNGVWYTTADETVWTNIWEFDTGLLNCDSFVFSSYVTTGGIAVAEIRLRSGPSSTSTYTLTNGSSGNLVFNWKHGLNPGAGPYTVIMEMRLTVGVKGGADILTVIRPKMMPVTSDAFGATLGGSPVLN